MTSPDFSNFTIEGVGSAILRSLIFLVFVADLIGSFHTESATNTPANARITATTLPAIAGTEIRAEFDTAAGRRKPTAMSQLPHRLRISPSNNSTIPTTG